MKIEIKGDDKEKLTISNDELDNENFVIVKTYDDESGLEVTIPIDQLLSAVSSFIELRNQQWQRDKHYSKFCPPLIFDTPG